MRPSNRAVALSTTVFGLLMAMGCQPEISCDELQARCADGSSEADVVEYRRQVDKLAFQSSLVTRALQQYGEVLNDRTRDEDSSEATDDRIQGHLDLIEEQLRGSADRIEKLRALDANVLVRGRETGAVAQTDSYCAVADVIKSQGFDKGLMSTSEVLGNEKIQSARARLAGLCPGRFDGPKSPGTPVQ